LLVPERGKKMFLAHARNHVNTTKTKENRVESVKEERVD
jgi:hypothetical protein